MAENFPQLMEDISPLIPDPTSARDRAPALSWGPPYTCVWVCCTSESPQFICASQPSLILQLPVTPRGMMGSESFVKTKS